MNNNKKGEKIASREASNNPSGANYTKFQIRMGDYEDTTFAKNKKQAVNMFYEAIQKITPNFYTKEELSENVRVVE